jgi:biotin operon repressor
MPDQPVTQNALYRHLKRGHENGQSVKTLAFLLGTEERAIRTLRNELVEAGIPVCAHPKHGYFIPQTVEEVQANYDWLRERGLSELTLAARLRSAFAQFTGLDQIADEDIPAL